MGGDKQVAIMVLKVDLECHRCYKKIKKVLCKFPQVHDQSYDEKANTVTIKVICCSPDKIKQKIKCKGGDTIKSIEIKPPEKPKPPPDKPKDEKPKPPPEKPKEPEKPKPPPEKPKEPEKPKPPPEKPKEPEKPKPPPEKPKEPEKPKPPPEKPKDPPPAPKPAPLPVQPVPVPVPVGLPQGGVHPFRACCPHCYDGRPGGPCFYGCVPAGPPPCYQYDGYYGRPVYDSYGCGRSYYASRCDYFSEENAGACAIM